MSERRWTDADLRAAWEAGARDGFSMGGSFFPSASLLDRAWEKSKPRARIRALEVARAGLPEGGR